MVRGVQCFVAVGLSMLLLGCGQSKLPTIKVEGQVTVDGKPYGPATISLSPTDGPTSKTPNASGPISADGKFTVNSYGPNSGVVPGTYSVALGMDPMNFNTPPIIKPTQITIAQDAKTVDVQLQTVKGAKPGFIPNPDSGGATTELAPLK